MGRNIFTEKCIKQFKFVGLPHVAACNALNFFQEGKLLFTITGLWVVEISKAFDSLNHKNLLGKLESLGLSSRSLRWFRSFLADRRQRVLINGELTDCRAVTHGVPQGSILDPLLFNIYVNSLPNAVKNAQVILYADDAVLTCTASTSVELNAILARDFLLDMRLVQ